MPPGRTRPLLSWPPPQPTSTRPDPEPRRRLTALRAAFHWAYATRPGWTWNLPLPQQSDELLRAVMAVCRSYQMPCRGLDYMSCDPELHYAELMTIAALGSVDPEDFLNSLRMQHPDDDFLAAGLDPDQRRGRQPNSH